MCCFQGLKIQLNKVTATPVVTSQEYLVVMLLLCLLDVAVRNIKNVNEEKPIQKNSEIKRLSSFSSQLSHLWVTTSKLYNSPFSCLGTCFFNY